MAYPGPGGLPMPPPMALAPAAPDMAVGRLMGVRMQHGQTGMGREAWCMGVATVATGEGHDRH